MQTLLRLALITSILCVASCDNSPTDSATTEDHSSHSAHNSDKSYSYQKPGANIRLSHNYAGASKVGETQNIELTFTEQYQSGQMNLRLIPDSSLIIQPAKKDYIFSMQDQQSHSIALSVRADMAGKYLLKIFASVMNETGQVSNRVMAVAFYVGDSSGVINKPQAPSSTDKVIVLPSLESGN